MTRWELAIWKRVYLAGAGRNHEGRARCAAEAVLEWRGELATAQEYNSVDTHANNLERQAREALR
jgi:CxxC motif-containing protein (DUF1111 family)